MMCDSEMYSGDDLTELCSSVAKALYAEYGSEAVDHYLKDKDAAEQAGLSTLKILQYGFMCGAYYAMKDIVEGKITIKRKQTKETDHEENEFNS